MSIADDAKQPPVHAGTPGASTSPMTVVLLAAAFGFGGFLVTAAFGGANYWHGEVAQTAVGAGFGWLVGAAVGMTLGNVEPFSQGEARALLVVAALFLLAGWTHWWAFDGIAGTSHPDRFAALERAIRLDSVIAAVTCIALATDRRVVRVIGALVAVGVAVTSAVLFFTGPCALQSMCPGPKI